MRIGLLSEEHPGSHLFGYGIALDGPDEREAEIEYETGAFAGNDVPVRFHVRAAGRGANQSLFEARIAGSAATFRET